MDTRTRVLEKVILESKDSSIEKISTINVSKKAKTSEANIYKLFKNKKNLLIETFLYIDNQLGQYLKKEMENIPVHDILEYSQEVWMKYLNFFVERKNYTHYYAKFRKSRLYTEELPKRQQNHFLFMEKVFSFIKNEKMIYQKIPYKLFWSFILDSTLLISERMAEEEIEYSKQNIYYSFHLIFDGLINMALNTEKNELNEKEVEV